MKYYINPSCSMGRFDDENVLVVCNDYLRKYECDAVILENIIAIIRKTGSIDEIYQFYKEEYTKDEIDEFLGILIQKGIIQNAEQERKAGRFAVLGEKENYLKIGIPVVKVFITKGTQLMGEPLLVASDRIYNFQKTMGYSENTTKYTELYLAPYPH